MIHTDYIAHIREADGKIQTVYEHLLAVQEYAEQAGAKIGFRYFAGLAGLLHDLGKNTEAFSTYIQQAVSSTNAANAPRRGSVDHSTAGGRLIHARYHHKGTEHRYTAEWLANCIISHHQGLRDYISPDRTSPYLERVEHRELKQYEDAVEEFFRHVPPEKLDELFAYTIEEFKQYVLHIRQRRLPPIVSTLLLKYLFSCLIDADRTNTRLFEEGKSEVPDASSQIADFAHKHHEFFQSSYDTLISHIHHLNKSPEANKDIQRLRQAMSEQCERAAYRPSGTYTLSIPTGGGKTLASMRYALRHALETGKDRIIYIVPYTTIIEQNAEEIRRILGCGDLILEHHSNVVDDQDDERTAEDDGEVYETRRKRLKLARDHWDSPIIFTTMVQFLNTFFGSGTRNVRRLHRLVNSVLIFDEVQSVPVHCISLFNSALNFLQGIGGSSLVLCTATQPALDYVKNELRLSPNPELIEKLDDVEQSFRRVKMVDLVSDSPSGWGAEKIGDFLQEQMDEVNNALVILNTKRAVRKLYQQLKAADWVRVQEIQIVHLSTNMCGAHRKDVLSGEHGVIRTLGRKRVICISTQLIEAGVNISFECVIRSLAGLDSIAQAAGRCNRHGRDLLRKVYVIRCADEVLTRLPEIRIGGEMTMDVLREFREQPEQLLSAKAMRLYFEKYFAMVKQKMQHPIPELEQNLFDLINANTYYKDSYCKRNKIQTDLKNTTAIATAERYFEAIQSHATPVLVPYGRGAELILDLNGEWAPGSDKLGDLLREAQLYTVNIYKHELDELHKNGDVYPLLHGQAWGLSDSAYSLEYGLTMENEGEWGVLMT
ncbi:CRISPR-associated helicase Cas3' [Paenibacillus peoriae]|uniref:CRISPR-associated helicase Cas3' n=1 Tax=Paenibacillus peoriae TaxID=59893 RepID=UPI003F95B1C5